MILFLKTNFKTICHSKLMLLLVILSKIFKEIIHIYVYIGVYILHVRKQNDKMICKNQV